MKNQSWSISTDPQVKKVIDDAYRNAEANAGYTSGTYDLTIAQMKESMAEWQNEHGGISHAPESAFKDQNNPNGYMLIHLNYPPNSHHVYLKYTLYGEKYYQAVLDEWPKANQINIRDRKKN